MLKKLLYSILPEEVFAKFRYRYRKRKLARHQPLTEGEFRALLTDTLGIKNGETLFVHSATDFLNIDFSPFRILNILLDIVGEEGNLLFPSWHFKERAEEYLSDKNNLFDVEKDRGVLGLIPELARRRKNAIRTPHPTTAIVIIGKNAEELAAEHTEDIYPCGEKSPFYKMMKYDAKIIGIGANTHFFSFLHCPEDMMKNEFPQPTRMKKEMIGNVRLKDDKIIQVKTLVAHQNIQKGNVPKFFRKYFDKETTQSFVIRGSEYFVADANKVYNRAIELAKEKITVYNP